jgi:hypothetical protein
MVRNAVNVIEEPRLLTPIAVIMVIAAIAEVTVYILARKL